MLHTLSPIAFSIAPLEIRYYSLMYLLGLVIGYAFLRYFANTDKKFPVKKDEIIYLICYLFVGIMIGAILGAVFFYNPEFYLSNPLEILMVWHGGMSIHGGLIGCVIAGLLFCKFKKINPLVLSDYLIIPAILGLSFGRIGNFLNGELWGRVTDFKICIDYSQNEFITNPPHGCRHASQIYAALKNLAIFVFLFTLYKRLKSRKPGTIFFAFLICYGVLRSLHELVREPSWVYMNLTAGQWLSIPLVIIGVLGLAFLYRANTKH
jgi:phosphatidylglycerol:prolipoprotein diacylglycerol transferase